MVKMPRKVMRYSPSAGKHTEHTVERVKKRRASELKWGQRRFRRVTAGYRGFPRPKPSGAVSYTHLTLPTILRV